MPNRRSLNVRSCDDVSLSQAQWRVFQNPHLKPWRGPNDSRPWLSDEEKDRLREEAWKRAWDMVPERRQVKKPSRQALPAPSVKVGGCRGTVEDTDGKAAQSRLCQTSQDNPAFEAHDEAGSNY